MTDPDISPAPRAPLWVILVRLGALVAIVLGAHWLVDWAMHRAEASANADMVTLGLILGLLVLYALLISVPFVPGIEIGISLLALRGAEIAPFIYLATVAGLMLAYVVGCRVPLDWLAAKLAEFRLIRAARLVADVAPLAPERRLALLRARLPDRLNALVGGWRYLVLALLVNLPGSGLIGGGGGICLVAGLSGLFRLRPTLLTLALAVAPVPLLTWGLGYTPDGWISLR